MNIKGITISEALHMLNEDTVEDQLQRLKDTLDKADKEYKDACGEVAKYQLKLVDQKQSDGSTVSVPDYSNIPEDQLDDAKKAYERYDEAEKARHQATDALSEFKKHNNIE